MKLFILAAAILMLAVAPASATVNPEANQPDYWCDNGIKYEPVDTPFIVPAAPEGTTWTLIVLKAGTTNESHALPVAGTAYSHSLHENSHVILCWETLTVTTTTTTEGPSTTTTSTAPSTTSTVPDTTTTTVPETTTSSSTTTVPDSSTSTEPSSTTLVPTTTVPPTTTTTVPILPVTGPTGLVLIGVVGALLTTLGAGFLRATRKDN